MYRYLMHYNSQSIFDSRFLIPSPFILNAFCLSSNHRYHPIKASLAHFYFRSSKNFVFLSNVEVVRQLNSSLAKICFPQRDLEFGLLFGDGHLYTIAFGYLVTLAEFIECQVSEDDD